VSIEHSTRALAALIAESDSGQILLPNFQRSFVWRLDDHRSLAASILLNVPCGSLLMVKGKSDDFASRRVGLTHSEDDAPQANCEFLLDGQQRASTIRAVFSNTFDGAPDWRAAWQSTFSQLRYRWSLRIRPGEDDPDLFGFSKLQFTGLQPEPSLIGDAFVPFPIYKTKGHDNWYHPAYKSDLGDQERILAIATAAAVEGVIPLWEVTESGSNDSGPIRQALQVMAEQRRQELYAAYKDGKLAPEQFPDLVKPGEDWDTLSQEKVKDRLGDRRAEWIQKVLKVVTDPTDFRLGTIELTPDELPKAIAIFEAINRGGAPLTPFDLVTARYARGQAKSSLPEMIQERIEKFPEDVPEQLTAPGERKWSASGRVALVAETLTPAFKSQFLQVLVMQRRLTTGGDPSFSVDDIKTQKVLDLSAAEIDAGWENATNSVLRAWRFLQLRCGVKDEGSLRNKLLILPIALALTDESVSAATYGKIEYWYWTSVLSDTYTARQNENSVSDTNSLLRWIQADNADNPFAGREQRVLADEGYSSKEALLRTGEDERVGTDVGVYLLQLTLALGGRDIIKNRPLKADVDEIQDHHLIPLATATSVGQSSRVIRKGKSSIASLLNSPLNRVYQLAETNQAIGQRPIAQYMKGLPADVKSSLFFTVDDDELLQSGEEGYEDYARKLMDDRYKALRAAVVNHLSKLKS
jgi:hypothetical protein